MIPDDLELEVEERFVMLPEWLIRADVKDAAVRLYAVLQRFGNQSGARMPGRTELASWMHCSVDKVDKAKAELERIGAISVTRSRPVAKGETGVTRAPNRYFLRTSDPAIGHLKPAHRGSRKSAATPSRREAATLAANLRPYREGKPTTTTTTSRDTDSSYAAVVVEIPEAIHPQIGDLLEIAAMCRSIRRELGKSHRPFTDVNVARAVVKALAAGHEPSKVAGGLIALARDPETRTVYRLEYDGPWWDLGDAELKRTRNRQAGQAKAAAIAACDRCDEHGWLLPDVNRLCDHQAAEPTAVTSA